MAKRKNNELNDLRLKQECEIRTDLLEQLDDNGMIGKQYEDMIEDYVELIKLKNLLIDDIHTKGIRSRVKTGNGFFQTKPNESVDRLLKVNAQMLKVLTELDLKKPKAADEDDLL
ncbi:RNA polymerase subunit sigma-70 [Alkalibaculum sp. M08DMB]|uniref:RNA polymerase subunit sigma-70 n=1 Tax=Alkalibaculum sporogenes TaxID=2655001 RepID=A0A6A7KA92_9FIRM|nr:RNA polymerase subunit sigma-70 [Alkalibaculum sporogenes]MPW26410.1 RNA polymerase subunit sigma-70 [Alkalibaculum sporogenes]